MLKNSGSLKNSANGIIFIASMVARAAHIRLSADTIVNTVNPEQEKPYNQVKIGVSNSQSLPDYKNEKFNAIVNEVIENNPEQGVKFENGILTYTPGSEVVSDKKKIIVTEVVEPAIKQTKKKK